MNNINLKNIELNDRLVFPDHIESKINSSDDIDIYITGLRIGIGSSIGNLLRKNLLSVVPGSSVIGLVLPNSQSENDIIKGVKEDVFELILNLKSVIFSLHERDEVCLKLRKSGTCEVFAKDITLEHDTEIINPEMKIASVCDGDLDATIRVRKDINNVYDAKSIQRHENEIVVAPSFSPVTRVTFDVSEMVLEKKRCEKLSMNIKTNGSIDVKNAIYYAIYVMKHDLNSLFCIDLSK